jgi:hypothetical protein
MSLSDREELSNDMSYGFYYAEDVKKTIKKLERCIKGLCNSKEEVQWVLNLIIKLFGKELTEEKAQ